MLSWPSAQWHTVPRKSSKKLLLWLRIPARKLLQKTWCEKSDPTTDMVAQAVAMEAMEVMEAMVAMEDTEDMEAMASSLMAMEHTVVAHPTDMVDTDTVLLLTPMLPPLKMALPWLMLQQMLKARARTMLHL